MRRLMLIFAAVACFCVTGCASKYAETNYGPTITAPIVIDVGEKSYIVSPNDGKYSSRTYAGSGAKTARALSEALAKYITNIAFGEYDKDQEKVFEDALEAGARYVYIPEILDWEARSPWGLRRSELLIDIKIYDLKKEGEARLILYKQLSQKGKMIPGITFPPGSKADALVKNMFTRFVHGMFKNVE